jgi:hypothetical protein
VACTEINIEHQIDFIESSSIIRMKVPACVKLQSMIFPESRFTLYPSFAFCSIMMDFLACPLYPCSVDLGISCYLFLCKTRQSCLPGLYGWKIHCALRLHVTRRNHGSSSSEHHDRISGSKMVSCLDQVFWKLPSGGCLLYL